MVLIRLASIADTATDGIGMGLNVFFQGCDIGCSGCQNPDLQILDGGLEFETEDLMDYIMHYQGFYDSVVFTGGDPLCQLTAVLDLVKMIKQKTALKTILYTGRVYSLIPKMISREFDIVVDGPYMATLAMPRGCFPASSNQRVYGSAAMVNQFMRNKRVEHDILTTPGTSSSI